jgi:transketolase
VSQEAAALAAHLGLDNLIMFYDSNNVTLDAMAPVTQSEDTAARFAAYGWEVHSIDGHDLQEVLNVFEKAKSAASGKPQFIVAKTLIGKGIPEICGTNKAHGEAGVKYVEASRKAIGLPDETFYVSPETHSYFAAHKKNSAAYQEWQSALKEWRKANQDLASELDAAPRRRRRTS